MKICHVTSVHKQDDIRIFRKQCSSLAKHGHDVTLLVANGTPEVMNGVKIVPFALKAKNRIQRFFNASKTAYLAAKKVDADIYQFHDPELLKMGVKLIKDGYKVVFDAHEDLPEQILSKHYLPRFSRVIISKWAARRERKLVPHLSYVFTATPFIRDKFKKINPNCIDINNYPIKTELFSDLADGVKKDQICYVGGLTKIRGILPLVRAMKSVHVTLQIAGNYSPSVFKQEVEAEEGYQKCDYHGMIDRPAVKKLMSESMLGVVTFLAEPNHINAQPNKIFEYMSAGLPVLASNFPLWVDLIEKNDCGICVDPTDDKAIAGAINELCLHPNKAKLMGQKGRLLIETTYNWEQEEQKMLNLYNHIHQN